MTMTESASGLDDSVRLRTNRTVCRSQKFELLLRKTEGKLVLLDTVSGETSSSLSMVL